jgi:hypothetical protein
MGMPFLDLFALDFFLLPITDYAFFALSFFFYTQEKKNKKKIMLRTPLRAVWDIVGYPTETIFWPAQKQNVKKTILFFIPGNPGLVEYYTPFLESIYKNTSSLEIVGGNKSSLVVFLF